MQFSHFLFFFALCSVLLRHATTHDDVVLAAVRESRELSGQFDIFSEQRARSSHNNKYIAQRIQQISRDTSSRIKKKKNLQFIFWQFREPFCSDLCALEQQFSKKKSKKDEDFVNVCASLDFDALRLFMRSKHVILRNELANSPLFFISSRSPLFLPLLSRCCVLFFGDMQEWTTSWIVAYSAARLHATTKRLSAKMEGRRSAWRV